MLHPDPVIRCLHACAVARVPVILWGGPGTGKTARVASYARMMSVLCERWLLSRCEPIDLDPRAITDKGIVKYDAPEVARLKAASEGRTGLVGILFADELNRAEKNVEGAALNLFDSPPPGVFVVAACNPPRSNHSARHLDSQTANRFAHLDVTADQPGWSRGIRNGWPSETTQLYVPSEADLRAAYDLSAVLITGYTDAQPHRLEQEPAEPVKAGRAWPSPRTWEYAIRLHAAATALGLGEDDTSDLLHGTIGPVAGELLEYIDRLNLPKVEDLLADPKGWTVADEPDVCHAVALAIAGAVKKDPTEARYDAAWVLANRMADEDMGTAAVILSDRLIEIWGTNRKLAPTTKRMGKRIAEIKDIVRRAD